MIQVCRITKSPSNNAPDVWCSQKNDNQRHSLYLLWCALEYFIETVSICPSANLDFNLNLLKLFLFSQCCPSLSHKALDCSIIKKKLISHQGCTNSQGHYTVSWNRCPCIRKSLEHLSSTCTFIPVLLKVSEYMKQLEIDNKCPFSKSCFSRQIINAKDLFEELCIKWQA